MMEQKVTDLTAKKTVRELESKMEAKSESAKQKLEELGSNRVVKTVSNILTVLLLIGCVVFGIYGYHEGIFSSEESLRDWVDGFGIAAPIVFMVLQAVQVGIPIIPGGVTLLAGVLIFGPWWGFWYNYIGITIGSVAVFAISHRYGKPLMYRLFSQESIEKYEQWTENHGRFTKLFALAIFVPGAPDGLICYLAGTTKMSWKTYMLIILLGKPLSIALYSLGIFGVSRGISAIGTVI